MSTGFNIEFGQELCDMLHAELALVCNFMDADGRIVASSRRERIGSVHPIARRIMQGEFDEYSVSAQEAERSGVMLEGMLTAIDLDGRRVSCFTLSGPLPVVRPLLRILRFCVTALLQTTHRGRDYHPPPAQAPATNLSELLQHASAAVGFSLARLHQAIEHIDEGVSLFDEKLQLVVWNQRYLELSGWPEEPACRGQSLQAMVEHFLRARGMDSAQARERLHKRLQRLRAGQANDFQFETPDGQVMAVADRPLPGGGAVSTYTDITERHRSMAALRSAREDAERLVRERTQTLDTYTRLSSDWFWESDAQFRTTQIYGDVLGKLKIAPGYFLGKRRWELQLVGVSAEQLAEHVARHQRHESFRNFEYGLLAPDGSTSYLSVSGAPRFDAEGRFIGYHGTGMDISERRRNQRLLQERSEALERANAEMERQVKERTEALGQQLSFMRQLLEAIPNPIFYKDRQARFLGANRAFEQFTGEAAERFLGRTVAELAPQRACDLVQDMAADAQLLREPGRQTYESRVQDARGQPRDMLCHKATFLRPDGSIGGIVGVMLDITERKQMEDELRLAATVFDNSSEAMAILGPDASVVAINQAFMDITGYDRQQAVGYPIRTDEDEGEPAGFFKRLQPQLEREGAWQGEVRGVRKSGEPYPVWFSIAVVRDAGGRTRHYALAFTDLSHKKRNEARIQQLAFQDPLTQLPNRRLLIDRLEHALVGAARKQCGGAVLLIDVDNFKSLNDTRGHDVGDELLRQLGQRLVACVHQGDTVARVSGDEFVVLVENLPLAMGDMVSQARSLCHELLLALQQPYTLAGEQHHHSASIGVALFGNQGRSVAELLKQADMAMYRAKEAGRNTLAFFDPQMQAAVDARTGMERAIRDGLQRGEFVPWYQPQLDDSGRVLGVEALVRWCRPDGSVVAPGAFIALAEETGLILQLGQQMLRAACEQLRAWAAHSATEGLTIAVNVSARQFHHADFAQLVLDILQASGAKPQRLKLEITESLLIDHIEEVIGRMQLLKAHGVGFALDDFGTGYSSLAYLKRLPLDQLKIDQGFVRGVLSDANDAAIARMVVALADSLGLQAVAEGVETPEHQTFLRQHGCLAYQGYLFSKPLPIAELEAWLARRPPAAPGLPFTGA
ncbi:EAL domain-containing protein [Comamonas sp. NLF-1-9]|uniref:EAL domain-containing protein n=1 Tax=Comamonas sp. NLF-1-9 TaxID=2853163 RepID=UPI001C46A464|nr:EAL domain-containing protein [Comamonas sp. NLF-1-9]QXL84489.1 EAL domain-containing protein [Comamonas sp. NLF-1-9]